MLAMPGDSEAPGYTTVSSAGSAAVTVTFVEGATLDAVAVLLDEHGAQIIGGPDALGIYRIAPSDTGDLASLQRNLEASELTTYTAIDQ